MKRVVWSSEDAKMMMTRTRSLEVHQNIALAVRFTKTAKLHAGIGEKSGPTYQEGVFGKKPVSKLYCTQRNVLGGWQARVDRQ